MRFSVQQDGLGVLPIIAGVVAGTSAIAAIGYGVWDQVSRMGLPNLPTPPNPVVPAPRAPQTAVAMTQPGEWTPADSAATADDWIAANQENLRNYNPGTAEAGGVPKVLLIGGLVLGGFALIAAAKKR